MLGKGDLRNQVCDQHTPGSMKVSCSVLSNNKLLFSAFIVIVYNIIHCVFSQPDLLKGVYGMGFSKPSKIQETALPLLLAKP